MDGRDGRQDGGRGPHEAEAERLLAERLTDGPLEEADRGERVRASLPPKYEVRIQTEYDPIVEETKRYRSMAHEIDGRYDRFMIRKGGSESDGPADGRTDRTEESERKNDDN